MCICSEQNRGCKLKCLEHDNKNKRIKSIKKKFYMVFNVRLILEKLIQIKNEIKNCLDVISYRNSSACEVDKYLKSIIQ